MQSMWRSRASVVAAGAAVLAAVAACQQRAPEPVPPPATAEATAADAIQRGRYLVAVIGCDHCHTPLTMGPNGPQSDMTRHLSGHPESFAVPPPPKLPEGPWMWLGTATNTAFAGPWGVTYATNLTPDQNTGMGIWTEEMFVAAMRTGKHMGTSRPIEPPMPWQAFQHLTDADLKALWAYLRSVPPIVNHVPDYQPPAGS
jgi:hypothetical protein